MRWDDELRRLSEQQAGLVSRRQLREIGVSSTEAGRMAHGTWHRVGRNAFRLAGAPVTPAMPLLAATMDLRGAKVSHACGAAWWGLPGFLLSPVVVTWTERGRPTIEDTVVRTVRELPERWVTELHGVPVVRPELLVLQLCADLHPARAERALDNAWKLRLVTGRSLSAFLGDLGRRGRNGTALLRRLVDERGPDFTPPDSNLEARVSALAARAGLRVRGQVDLGGDTWTGRVDYLVVGLPIVIEVQSELHHSALSDRRADAERRAELEAAGFAVLEVSDTDVWSRGDEVVAAFTALRRSVERSATPA